MNTFTHPFGGARMHQLDGPPKSAGSQHKVECGSPAVRGASNLEQQVAAEQIIDRIARFSWKIELSRKNWTVRRLEPDMIVPGSAWIQTRHNRLQRIPSTGISELMSSTAKSVKIVPPVGVGMPEIEQSACYRFSISIQNRSTHAHRHTGNAWFTEVGPGR